MELKLDIYDPEDMEAFAVFLNARATTMRKRQEEQRLNPGLGVAGLVGWQNKAMSAEAEPELSTEAPNVVEEQKQANARKPRAKKAEAEKPADAAPAWDEKPADAAPAWDEKPAEEAKPEQDAPERDEKPAEEKPLTRDEVRNSIIDLLNAVVEKHPDDADIRVKTLKSLLDKLGAAKISEIKDEDFGKVPALLAKIREQEGLA